MVFATVGLGVLGLVPCRYLGGRGAGVVLDAGSPALGVVLVCLGISEREWFFQRARGGCPKECETNVAAFVDAAHSGVLSLLRGPSE